jgi:hypothetical protein
VAYSVYATATRHIRGVQIYVHAVRHGYEYPLPRLILSLASSVCFIFCILIHDILKLFNLVLNRLILSLASCRRRRPSAGPPPTALRSLVDLLTSSLPPATVPRSRSSLASRARRRPFSGGRVAELPCSPPARLPCLRRRPISRARDGRPPALTPPPPSARAAAGLRMHHRWPTALVPQPASARIAAAERSLAPS